MSEVEAVVETVVEGGGLPSDNVAPDYSGFDLSDDIKGKFKDGKLNGRFSSMDDVLSKLKEAEDFRAATISEQKKAENVTDETVAKEKTEAVVAEKKQAVAKELVPEFMKNGMQLTPEMETKATEAGIDIRDLKISAMELRDATTAAHNLTGGAENYEAMRTWAEGVLDAKQKASFDNALSSGMGEYAIKGLYAEFQKASDNGEVGRIEGQTVFTGVKPYSDRRELYKDKDYIESNAGRRDTAAQKLYRSRLSKTSNDVIFGRQ